MSAELIERLRSRESLEAVDPKAVYRTRPVALFEQAADALASKEEALALAGETLMKLDIKINRLEDALALIARGKTPPEQHGHYLAHREAVNIARLALQGGDVRGGGESP